MEIIKVAIVGIVGIIAAIQFKNTKPEYSLYIGFAVGLFAFSYACRILMALTEEVMGIKIFLNGEDRYLGILLKVIGIAYLCEFSAGICKDAGFPGVAGQIEVFGKLSVLFAGMPILLAVIQTIQQM